MADRQAPPERPFVHRLRVRYGECDPQGIVFNANYLAYMDHSITELWRAAFGSYDAMVQRGVDIVVGEANLRFRSSARFDQELDLEIGIVHLGTTSIGSRHRITAVTDAALILEADARHVAIDPGTGVKTPLPDWLRAGLTPWHVVAG